jgi:hypothetical protein
VTAYDATVPQADEQSPAFQVAQRFPRADETFQLVTATKAMQNGLQKPVAAGGKGDRLPGAAACERQEWPYIDQSCLVSVNGSPVRKVVRYVTVERRVGDNTSEAVRMPASTLAAR